MAHSSRTALLRAKRGVLGKNKHYRSDRFFRGISSRAPGFQGICAVPQLEITEISIRGAAHGGPTRLAHAASRRLDTAYPLRVANQ